MTNDSKTIMKLGRNGTAIFVLHPRRMENIGRKRELPKQQFIVSDKHISLSFHWQFLFGVNTKLLL